MPLFSRRTHRRRPPPPPHVRRGSESPPPRSLRSPPLDSCTESTLREACQALLLSPNSNSPSHPNVPSSTQPHPAPSAVSARPHASEVCRDADADADADCRSAPRRQTAPLGPPSPSHRCAVPQPHARSDSRPILRSVSHASPSTTSRLIGRKLRDCARASSVHLRGRQGNVVTSDSRGASLDSTVAGTAATAAGTIPADRIQPSSRRWKGWPSWYPSSKRTTTPAAIGPRPGSAADPRLEARRPSATPPPHPQPATSRPSLHLNRQLPPLPALDQWKPPPAQMSSLPATPSSSSAPLQDVVARPCRPVRRPLADPASRAYNPTTLRSTVVSPRIVTARKPSLPCVSVPATTAATPPPNQPVSAHLSPLSTIPLPINRFTSPFAPSPAGLPADVAPASSHARHAPLYATSSAPGATASPPSPSLPRDSPSPSPSLSSDLPPPIVPPKDLAVKSARLVTPAPHTDKHCGEKQSRRVTPAKPAAPAKLSTLESGEWWERNGRGSPTTAGAVGGREELRREVVA